MVRDALAGYNTSIVSYGQVFKDLLSWIFSFELEFVNQNFLMLVIIWNSDQSGSGKTYTMWGPPSAMVDDPSPLSSQGLAPRVFQMLFSEIEKVRFVSMFFPSLKLVLNGRIL